MEVQGNQRGTTILCPMCGIQFTPTLSNICQGCMLSKTDITIGITKQAIINFCRFCHRYNKPGWVTCDRDSKQLLAILLKKIKGLNKAKIINAGFIWTQCHSKRIKVKLTIQKQLNNNTRIQQTFITQFIEHFTQCQDCKKQFTPHTWGAVVQLRQHVDHKKTFYYIQQLILKHGAYDKVLKISTQDDGINFYYKNTTHAQRLIDFLAGILPVTVKNSKQLISHDQSSNIFSYKYTFSVHLPQLCRNDLVLLPKKIAKELGGVSRLCLCLKVAQCISLVDLNNYNFITMNCAQYQHHEKDLVFLPLARYRKQFQILNSQPCERKKQHNTKSSLNKLVSKQYMYNISKRGQYQNIVVKGHLGQLHAGALVQGFDLRDLCHNQDLDDINGIQDVVLVRRFQDKSLRRAFKLKKLQDQGVMIDQQSKFEKKRKPGKLTNEQKDYQQFLDDVAADSDLRKDVKLYKDDQLKNMNKQQLQQVLGQIQICELLQDMNIQQKAKQLQNAEGQQLDGIDDLISRMDKVTIQKEQ